MTKTITDILNIPFATWDDDTKYKIVTDGRPKTSLVNLESKNKDSKIIMLGIFQRLYKIEWLTECQQPTV